MSFNSPHNVTYTSRVQHYFRYPLQITTQSPEQILALCWNSAFHMLKPVEILFYHHRHGWKLSRLLIKTSASGGTNTATVAEVTGLVEVLNSALLLGSQRLHLLRRKYSSDEAFFLPLWLFLSSLRSFLKCLVVVWIPHQQSFQPYSFLSAFIRLSSTILPNSRKLCTPKSSLIYFPFL